MAGEKHDFLKNGSNLFLHEALETGDHVEAVRKIRFLARVIFESKVAFMEDAALKIDQTDLPVGQISLQAGNPRCRPGFPFSPCGEGGA